MGKLTKDLQGKLRKKFNEESYILCVFNIYRDSILSGYEADISDSSLIFPAEASSEPSEALYPDIIDTSTIDLPSPTSPAVDRTRAEGAKKLWEFLALKDLEKNPAKVIKGLTVAYTHYLGTKFRKLFQKYKAAPWKTLSKRIRKAKTLPFSLSYIEMIEIFDNNRMSQLFEMYYEYLNSPVTLPEHCTDKADATKKSAYTLFKLLEREFREMYHKNPYRKMKEEANDS